MATLRWANGVNQRCASCGAAKGKPSAGCVHCPWLSLEPPDGWATFAQIADQIRIYYRPGNVIVVVISHPSSLSSLPSNLVGLLYHFHHLTRHWDYWNVFLLGRLVGRNCGRRSWFVLLALLCSWPVFGAWPSAAIARCCECCWVSGVFKRDATTVHSLSQTSGPMVVYVLRNAHSEKICGKIRAKSRTRHACHSFPSTFFFISIYIDHSSGGNHLRFVQGKERYELNFANFII